MLNNFNSFICLLLLAILVDMLFCEDLSGTSLNELSILFLDMLGGKILSFEFRFSLYFLISVSNEDKLNKFSLFL